MTALTLRRYSSAAWIALALGVVLSIVGALHTSAVISVALKQGKPYDFRMVALLATGGVLIYSGLINIGISWWIRQGHPWALAISAAVIFPLMVYHGLLAPAHHSNQWFGAIVDAIYLCFLIRVAVSTR